MPKDKNAKERILRAASKIIQHADDLEAITMREIADKAGVGLGSINYHFGSKDNLLLEAVGQLMGDQAEPWFVSAEESAMDPVSRLKMLIKETAKVAVQYPKLSRVAIKHSLLEDNLETEQMVLPLLREIFESQRNEIELRLIAFTLMKTTQSLFYRAEEFRLYAGIDIFNDTQRESSIDTLVDLLIINNLEK